MNHILGIFLFVVLFASPVIASEYPTCNCEAETCYTVSDLGEHPLKFNGQLEKEIGYGPPGWGEHPDRDQKFTYYVLRLMKRICLKEGDGKDNYLLPVVRIQLTGDLNESAIDALLGPRQTVVVTGHVWTGHSPWHQLPVLIEPTSVRASKPGP